jgi:predicted Zn finger-like uncharacterized protein
MANVRITCPTCHAELEIEEEHVGREVDCGGCLKTFIARESLEEKSRLCPFCASLIPAKAKKCRECGETLDVTLRAAEDARMEAKEARRSTRRGSGIQQQVIIDERDDDYGPSRARHVSPNPIAACSLVLGMLAYPLLCGCWPIAIPVSIGGIVSGIIGMQKTERKGMAITGAILSLFLLILLASLFIFGVGLNMANVGLNG